MADAHAKPTISNSRGKSFWKQISDDLSSGVKVVKEKLHIVIPPYYLEDLKKNLTDVIDSRLIRYEKHLGGILAGYGKLVIEHPEAELLFDLSNIHVDVVGDFYIFTPDIKRELTGIVNKKSHDHIGCLVHGLFNVSLPKPRVHSENWFGSHAKLRDKVRFSITKVDLNAIVPHIEGKVIELIPNTESVSEERHRISSDSGVSIASEESMNIVVTPEAKMDRKKSKLSLSQKKASTVVADKVTHETVEENGKKKRKISEGSATQETPLNKRAKPSDNTASENVSEDFTEVDKLSTNLFKKYLEKRANPPTPSRKQKKKEDALISDQASVATEKSIDPKDGDLSTPSRKLKKKEDALISDQASVAPKISIEPKGGDLSTPSLKLKKKKKDVPISDQASVATEKSIQPKDGDLFTPSRKPKKKEDALISDQASIAMEKKIEPKMVTVPDDLSQRIQLSSSKTAAKKRKMEEDSKIKEKINSKPNVDVKLDRESSDSDFVSSQKIPSTQNRSRKLTKKLDESEKRNSIVQEFKSSPKTPSQSKLEKNLNAEFENESICSDQDFMISQKTPVSKKKTKLTEKLDVLIEKESTSDGFSSSQKIPSSKKKSKLASNTDLEAIPAKKTPFKPVKVEKSKNTVEKHKGAIGKKQKKAEDSDPENDYESIIQEILNSSRSAAAMESTPTGKTSQKKQTPLSKIKQASSVKKSTETPLKSLTSAPVSLPVKEIVNSAKKNAKGSSSGKSLKALASEEEQKVVKTDQEISSPKKASKKQLKTASVESVSNISVKEKKVEVQSIKKRIKLKKEAYVESDEDIRSTILKSIQMKEKTAKNKT